MATIKQTLEADLRGTERAIRHLIGERAALASRLKRAEARLKLDEARLRALLRHAPLVRTGDQFADVSMFQPHVDYAAMVRGRFGAISVTKLSEGLRTTDPFGDTRLGQMHAAGVSVRGGYHFAHPSEPGAAQAEHFLAAGGSKLGKDDLAICDLEVSDGMPALAVRACAKDFAVTVHQHSPATLILYGGGPFLSEFAVPLAPYDAHWLAAYVTNPTRYMCYGRARTRYWQHSDGRLGPLPHVCPGVGACDLSVVL